MSSQCLILFRGDVGLVNVILGQMVTDFSAVLVPEVFFLFIISQGFQNILQERVVGVEAKGSDSRLWIQSEMVGILANKILTLDMMFEHEQLVLTHLSESASV